jgi:hypothetical protein
MTVFCEMWEIGVHIYEMSARGIYFWSPLRFSHCTIGVTSLSVSKPLETCIMIVLVSMNKFQNRAIRVDNTICVSTRFEENREPCVYSMKPCQRADSSTIVCFVMLKSPEFWSQLGLLFTFLCLSGRALLK